jgi:hypothetical protein
MPRRIRIREAERDDATDAADHVGMDEQARARVGETPLQLVKGAVRAVRLRFLVAGVDPKGIAALATKPIPDWRTARREGVGSLMWGGLFSCAQLLPQVGTVLQKVVIIYDPVDLAARAHLM